jgi:HupE / UreJ protein
VASSSVSGAGGTDHLLFLLVLLLPALLMVSGSRWAGFAGVRLSVLCILKVVTAFTIGHSITLAFAALGLVHVPSRPIEVLIAVSILVSAIHALRPIFPGKEAGIAAFFGLVHGLAFAATLSELGLGRWERVFGILAFNLGIETMQLIVVAVTMPSLVLMSRTRAYPFLRIGGALFAGFASLGWIAERLFSAHISVDVVMDMLTRHALWIAGAVFLISLCCWWLRDILDQPTTCHTAVPSP